MDWQFIPWLAIAIFAGATVALFLLNRWGNRSRTVEMKKFADAHNLQFSETSAIPLTFPAHSSGSELRNALRGKWDGHDIFVVDEHVHAFRASHIRTVVGFKTYSPTYREWYDRFRWWQVHPEEGWIWVYRKFWYVPEKDLERFLGRAWKEASSRMTA